MRTTLLAALLPTFGVPLEQGALGLQDPAGEHAAAVETWDELSAAYEQAVVAWVEEWVPRFRQDRSELPGTSPAGAFWPRYEAQAAGGEERALPWLLRNVDEAPETGPSRSERLQALLAGVRAAGNAAWVADAIPALVARRAELDGDYLESTLGALAQDETTPATRRAALLGLAEIVAARDPEQAFGLRLSAFGAPGETLDLATPGAPALDGISRRVQATLEQEGASYIQEWYVLTDDGYFSKPAAPPSPLMLYRPLLEELARRRSPSACIWVIGNTWNRDEATRGLLAHCLDVVSEAELDAELLGDFSWRVSTLVGELGWQAVEPKVRHMLEGIDPGARAALLYSLGMGLCEAAGQDPALRERGLAVLREVAERWPESKEARRAAGQVFRHTSLLVGQYVPDFEAVDVDGQAFKLSDYAGKVTVIDFWGFW